MTGISLEVGVQTSSSPSLAIPLHFTLGVLVGTIKFTLPFLLVCRCRSFYLVRICALGQIFLLTAMTSAPSLTFIQLPVIFGIYDIITLSHVANGLPVIEQKGKGLGWDTSGKKLDNLNLTRAGSTYRHSFGGLLVTSLPRDLKEQSPRGPLTKSPNWF